MPLPARPNREARRRSRRSRPVWALLRSAAHYKERRKERRADKEGRNLYVYEYWKEGREEGIKECVCMCMCMNVTTMVVVAVTTNMVVVVVTIIVLVVVATIMVVMVVTTMMVVVVDGCGGGISGDNSSGGG